MLTKGRIIMEYSVKRKINIFGRVAKIITTVVIVCLLVAEGFMLTGAVIVAVVPKDSVTVDAQVQGDVKINTRYFGYDGEEFSVNVGDNKITLGEIGSGDLKLDSKDGVMTVNGDFKNISFDLTDALLLIVFGMLSVAAMVVALYFFRALMKQFMICDTPFCDGVVQKMRNFAIALIPCMAVVQGMKSAVSAVFSHDFNLDIDLVCVAFVFIIFVLTMVFKYGTELQKEHDETV